MYEKTYGTARLVLGIVAISGWLVLAVGVIAIVSSFFAGGEPNLTMMMAGIAMLASGLVLVAASQVSFAILDQADISRANLAVLRKIADAQGVNLQSPATAPATSAPSQMRAEPKLRHGKDAG